MHQTRTVSIPVDVAEEAATALESAAAEACASGALAGLTGSLCSATAYQRHASGLMDLVDAIRRAVSPSVGACLDDRAAVNAVGRLLTFDRRSQ